MHAERCGGGDKFEVQAATFWSRHNRISVAIVRWSAFSRMILESCVRPKEVVCLIILVVVYSMLFLIWRSEPHCERRGAVEVFTKHEQTQAVVHGGS